MRAPNFKLALIAITTAALVVLISAWAGRGILLDYIAFRCGFEWLSPSSPLEHLLFFRFGFGGFGLLAAILSTFPLGPYSLRAFNAAFGITCTMLAIFSGGWQLSRTAYLNGLAAAVSKPEIRAALHHLQNTTRNMGPGTEIKIKPEEIPKALRELGNPFFGATILRSGEVRLLWGRRATGGWGICVAPTPPAGANVHAQQVFKNVYVHMIEPF